MITIFVDFKTNERLSVRLVSDNLSIGEKVLAILVDEKSGDSKRVEFVVREISSDHTSTQASRTFKVEVLDGATSTESKTTLMDRFVQTPDPDKFAIMESQKENHISHPKNIKNLVVDSVHALFADIGPALKTVDRKRFAENLFMHIRHWHAGREHEKVMEDIWADKSFLQEKIAQNFDRSSLNLHVTMGQLFKSINESSEFAEDLQYVDASRTLPTAVYTDFVHHTLLKKFKLIYDRSSYYHQLEIVTGVKLKALSGESSYKMLIPYDSVGYGVQLDAARKELYAYIVQDQPPTMEGYYQALYMMIDLAMLTFTHRLYDTEKMHVLPVSSPLDGFAPIIELNNEFMLQQSGEDFTKTRITLAEILKVIIRYSDHRGEGGTPWKRIGNDMYELLPILLNK